MHVFVNSSCKWSHDVTTDICAGVYILLKSLSGRKLQPCQNAKPNSNHNPNANFSPFKHLCSKISTIIEILNKWSNWHGKFIWLCRRFQPKQYLMDWTEWVFISDCSTYCSQVVSMWMVWQQGWIGRTDLTELMNAANDLLRYHDVLGFWE